ncbi:hypothetical protein KFZ70_03270 [Tamlana fucoidanivorans]|nr:hypothetical protein [Tamlana fucoidanivorans]
MKSQAKNISGGSYGCVGANWSFAGGRTIERRLNLNNMGSIGAVWKNKII